MWVVPYVLAIVAVNKLYIYLPMLHTPPMKLKYFPSRHRLLGQFLKHGPVLPHPSCRDP